MIINITKLALLLICLNIYAQKKEKFVFHSIPTFHSGFSIELLDDDILKFTTYTNYYVVNSLKLNNKNLVETSNNDEFLSNNKHLLANSSSQIQLDVSNKKFLIETINRLVTLNRNQKDKKIGFDGITFLINTYEDNPVEIWSPDKDSEEAKIILDLFEHIQRLYNPNTNISKNIFESRLYINEDTMFEIVDSQPVFLRFYDASFSFFYCYKLIEIIKKLPESDLLYLDFSQLTEPIHKDTKACLVEEFNKKYKQIKVIQTKENGEFNSFK